MEFKTDKVGIYEETGSVFRAGVYMLCWKDPNKRCTAFCPMLGFNETVVAFYCGPNKPVICEREYMNEKEE